ncbi:thioesterase II family protein [Streptomyces piniterrae]|uniref:thioesterase II family protein n=1 Tax=Streptomyces piniterrae TaxID=2571125 RepID=UPI00145CA274|nr:alpha/beta fold hydrolase [Streptomyces piniterrae]
MAISRVSSRWFASFGEQPPAGPSVVCLPYAGGSASVFRPWARYTDSLHVLAVQLPGREQRMAEPAASSLDELLAGLLPQLRRLAGGEYALYGHSMGALIAFEAARRVRALDLPAPSRLYVAGCPAPHIPQTESVYDLPRDELLAWLADGNGLDPAALEYPELIDLMLHTVRADLAVVDTYRYRAGPPLDIPIRVFHGAADKQLPTADAYRWQEMTTGEFDVQIFHGGHFFVQDHGPDIVSAIERDLLCRQEAENS